MFDERFIRHHDDGQPQTHPFSVAEPRWEHEHFRVDSPTNWPASSKWEEGFDLTEADDHYGEINPYDSPRPNSNPMKAGVH